MKLADLTEKTPLVKDFSQYLAKSVGEAIVAIVVNKAKRISGVSATPVDFNLENGQVVTAYIRVVDEKYDMYRVDVNGKQLPTTGDLDNEYKPSFKKSVDEIANFVKRGQAGFDKKQASTKVRVASSNRNASVSMAKQIQELKVQSQELDNQLTNAEQTEKTLVEQLAAAKNNKIG